jgi:hypothetical protein
VSIKLLVGLAVIGSAPAVIRADPRAILAEVAPTVPFDVPQLTSAIRLRVPAAGGTIRVRVLATPDGVRIEAGGNTRDVALGGLTGPSAARLVALAASDLLLEDLPAMPLARSRDVPMRSTGSTVTALGGAAVWPRAFGRLSLDVAVARGAWLFAIEAGGGTLVDGPLQLSAATLRIGGGARVDLIELRATATLMPLIVSDGDGDRTILAGAGANARLRIPVAAAVHGVIAVGIDVFATRTSYVVDNMLVLTTPRHAPWLALGLEVTP